MSKKKTNSWQFLYDHWLIIFGVIISVSGIAILESLRKTVTDIVNQSYSGWVACGIIIGVLLVRKLLRKKKPKSGVVRAVSPPPKYRHEEFEPVEQYGVNWHFWRGNNVPSAFDYALSGTPLRSWVDGPFCATCEYELEEDSNGEKWVCAKGHKTVKIPEVLRNDVRNKMIKIFDADLRQQSKKEQK